MITFVFFVELMGSTTSLFFVKRFYKFFYLLAIYAWWFVFVFASWNLLCWYTLVVVMGGFLWLCFDWDKG